MDEIIRPRPQGSSPVYEYVAEGTSFGLPVSLRDRDPWAEGACRLGPRMATSPSSPCVDNSLPFVQPCPAACWAAVMPLPPSSLTVLCPEPLPSVGQDVAETVHMCAHVGKRGCALDVCVRGLSLERAWGGVGAGLFPKRLVLAVSPYPAHKTPVLWGLPWRWGLGPVRQHQDEELPTPPPCPQGMRSAPLADSTALGPPGLRRPCRARGMDRCMTSGLWLQEDTPRRRASSGSGGLRSWWKRDSGDSRTFSRMSRPQVSVAGPEGQKGGLSARAPAWGRQGWGGARKEARRPGMGLVGRRELQRMDKALATLQAGGPWLCSLLALGLDSSSCELAAGDADKRGPLPPEVACSWLPPRPGHDSPGPAWGP